MSDVRQVEGGKTYVSDWKEIISTGPPPEYWDTDDWDAVDAGEASSNSGYGGEGGGCGCTLVGAAMGIIIYLLLDLFNQSRGIGF